MEGVHYTSDNGTKKFRSILTDLLNPDNEIRSKAEESYEEIPAVERTLLLITALGDQASPPEEAELAAVLLRRLLFTDFDNVFSRLSPEIHCQIKNQLLHHIQQDISRNFRKKICDVAAELARNLIDEEGNNQWPEFLKFLFDSANSPNSAMRESSLLMFSAVPGVFGNQQDRYIDLIRQMLSQSLVDQESPEVRLAAVKATTAFILAHEKEINVLRQFGDCLSLLLQLLNTTLEDPESIAEEILRQLIDLVETCPQFFRGQFDILFQICVKGISIESILDPVRHLSLEVLVALSETAPAMVRKLGSKHINTLIPLIFKMMTDLDEDPQWDFVDDDNSEDDNDSNPVIGEASLDRLACALGGKTILPLVVSRLPQMLNSSDWKERYAGLMSISAIGEGCHKPMNGILQQIVDGVIAYLHDPHPRVRYAACNALGQMSTDFAPNFQKKFHDKVIPQLLLLMEDTTSSRVQAHAGAALVNFFEDCPKNTLAPYLDNIVEKLESVLKSKFKELVEKGTKLVLEQVVVTIASLADCAEEKFLNYYEKFMPCLKYIIQNALSADLRVLRGKTIECVSLIGMAVGKDKFLSDASEVMDLLLKSQSMNSPIMEDDPQLSYMIAAWARICKILGKAFEPYLPYVMQPVLKAASLKPEIAVLDSDDMKVVENDDDWEFVNLGEKHSFGIHTTGLDDKATACQMLVCYARELKEGFAAYVEETVKLMVPMLKFYFHDGVRIAAAEILPYLLESAKVRGESYVQEMWVYILSPLLQAMDTEPESEVLCELMSAFAMCLEVLNYTCLSHDDIIFLIKILCKNLENHFEKAQQREEQRKEEDYDEVLEEALGKEDIDDVYLLGKVTEIVSGLLSIYKQDFFVYFDLLLQHYINLSEPKRPWADRQWALCVFADIIEHTGPAMSRYQQYFLQPTLNALNDESVEIRQTAAYTVGLIGQFAGPEYAKLCSDTIPVLAQLINIPESRSEDNIRVTENAISAVGKILAFNNSLINMEEIMPMWVAWLPIWEDEAEVAYVYNFLCNLMEQNNPLLLGKDNCNLPRIIAIIAETFNKEAIDVTSEVGKRIITLMRHVQSNGELFSLCISQLSPQQQEALHSALTSQ